MYTWLVEDSPGQHRPAQTPSLWSALQLAWNLGYLIALPVVAFGFIGASLDRRLGTSPWCTLIGFILAIVLSGIAVWRKVREVTREMEKENHR